MLLPFLPGEYDPVALPLSTTVQAFGFIGLLLVPVGILWLRAPASRRIAMLAVGTVPVVGLPLGFIGLTFGPSLGVVLTAFSAGIASWLWRGTRAGAAPRVVHALFIMLPLILVASRSR